MSDKPGNISLGRLLVAWESGAQKTPEEIGRALELLDVCGGAYLFLNRAEAEKIQASGARFDADPHRTIPVDGRGSVRLRCKQPLMTKELVDEIDDGDGSPPRVHKRTVKFGLCARCEGWEKAIRERLRKEAKEAEQKAATGTRKRGFREDAAE